MNIKKFLVLKLPRTGSTLLGKVLNNHPEIVCQNEILNDLQEADLGAKLAYLENYFSSPYSQKQSSQKAIVGATMNPFKYHLEASDLYPVLYGEPEDAESQLPRVAIILLLRQNKLKQAVSFYLALERGRREWESSLHLIEDSDALKPKLFDLTKLAKLVTRLEQQSERLREFANSIAAAYLTVFHEEIIEDSQAALNHVFQFLGASQMGQDFDFTAGYQKVLSEDLRQTISNYDDLYRNPCFHPYLKNC
jgi:LPS sulfotransferase NodH